MTKNEKKKKPNISNLISRAREYAELAENATRGPWRVIFDYIYADGLPIASGIKQDETYQANMKLMSSSPVMAWILADMADVLEKVLQKSASVQKDELMKELYKMRDRYAGLYSTTHESYYEGGLDAIEKVIEMIEKYCSSQ